MLPVPTDNQEAPKLTGHQYQFVQLYLTTTRADAVAAVRMMGLSEDEKVLRRIAGRFLNHPAVQWHIQKYAAQQMAPTEVLSLFAAHARGDQGDFWDISEATGQPVLNLKRAKELGITRLIKKLAIGKDGQVTLELYDAQAAARELAKIYGLHRQDSNVNIVIEHVLRGLSDEVRDEVMATLGGLIGGALPAAEEDVIDAEGVELPAKSEETTETLQEAIFKEDGELSDVAKEVIEEILAGRQDDDARE